MSIFKDILNKLLGKDKPAATTTATTTPPAAGTPTSAGAPSGTAPAAGAGAAPPGNVQGTTGAPAGAQATPLSGVDVEAIMDRMAQQSGQTLNWRTSIVDTMKALGIDSSLEHRKELARELHYSGDMDDSAAMNVWLHKRLMQELAANGGKLPKELS
ncbi:DUF3597 domain-containing protein [Cupriavidus taiwanensis]|uniref:DUF3597 domain-containing protein n=1 Tax=Cupriavidus taiwanensis TaxID=164546 RepID=A0A375JCI8_9BURK|nr:DUF3597 domain-containing protein [Cupriavidus taiwanensis]SPS01683.1 conserved hypothetical protein [Cupriavidus taiwanensis]